MSTITLQKKRKNIDLPIETLQKLSIMAASQGKSLKAFIEYILEMKANNFKIEITPNPSPSKDPWFEDKQNMESVTKGIEESKQGKTKIYTMDEIKNLLEV